MDFFQHGPVALHDLGRGDGELRRRVARAAASRRACVVLPMLHEEMRRPAILGIRDGLRSLDHLHEVVVPLSAQRFEEVEEVRDFFADLPFPVRVLWCEGPAVAEALHSLTERGFDLSDCRGKGLAVWLGLGAAQAENDAIAVHDADIERYDARLVDRLLFPILAEELDLRFAKGYYARLTGDALYGRVVRLFVWPFLDALQDALAQPSPLLSHLRSYRYPLAGEMALTSDLARRLPLATGWGLELGLLGEVHASVDPTHICQVDLGIYSHKHNPIGERADEGLQRMVSDIAATVLRLLASREGAALADDALDALRASYLREAREAIRRYRADALFNGLRHDAREEEAAAASFERLLPDALRRASHEGHEIGSWRRALDADPDAATRLRAATVPRALSDRLRDAATEAAI